MQSIHIQGTVFAARAANSPKVAARAANAARAAKGAAGAANAARAAKGAAGAARAAGAAKLDIFRLPFSEKLSTAATLGELAALAAKTVPWICMTLRTDIFF